MVEIVDPVETPFPPGSWFSDGDLAPIWKAAEEHYIPLLILLFVFVTLVLLKFMWGMKGKHEKALQLMKPMERFISELTRAASPGHDKVLFAMLPSEVLSVVEKGTIRAMGRCVLSELGTFIEIEPVTFSLSKQRDPRTKRTVYQATGSCKFSQAKESKKVTVNWFHNSTSRYAQILGFQFATGDDGSPLNVTNHVDPKEFEGYGGKFVTSLMTKSPSWAHKAMLPGLAGKYATPEKLAEEVMKILRVVGGFKGATPDITLTGTSMFEVNTNSGQGVTQPKNEKPASDANKGEEAEGKKEDNTNKKVSSEAGSMTGPTPKGVTLQYHIAGRQRDMSAEIRLVFVGLQTKVARYELRSAKSLNEKTMLVDQDTGGKTMIE